MFVQILSDLHERVDFVTCLGGDGVILHASNLFRTSVPPIVSFNLGSLGFLTSHIVCFTLNQNFIILNYSSVKTKSHHLLHLSLKVSDKI